MNTEFKADLTRFLSALVESGPEMITDNMDLIETGVIDSLNIVSLLVFIEERTGANIPIETLDLEHIRNIKAIMARYANQEQAS